LNHHSDLQALQVLKLPEDPFWKSDELIFLELAAKDKEFSTVAP
jgi:hypothetical protein